VPISVIQGNVLDAKADSLVITIDGAKKGLEGNVARAFARRWQDAFWDIEEQIRYPLPLGRTVATHPENESGFPLVLVAATLHHIDVLTDSQKVGVIRSALTEAIGLARRNHANTVAMTAMTGGWRLDESIVLGCMFDVLRPLAQPDQSMTILLHMLSESSVQLAADVARQRKVEIQTRLAKSG
jgi:O-acetyl-ADP-ribose deacetylase (regulator of RNase III)